VKGYQGPAAPPAMAAAGPARISPTSGSANVVIETAGTRLVIDAGTGQIASWRAGDRDIVLAGPILNLGEWLPASTARPGRNAPPPPISSTEPPRCRNAKVAPTMAGANARVEVTCDVYLAGSDEVKGQLNYTLDIGPDAQADVAWKLTWKAADATAREAGLKFLLPASADRMSWSSERFFPEYPADHIGNPQGSITSKDATFNSARRDIHWVSLSGAGTSGLVALSAGKPLHTHASAASNGTTLFLSSGIASTGRDVTGDDIRLTQATPLTGGFRLRVAARSGK